MATQTLAQIKRIIIHCAATPPTMDIGVETIRKWHKDEGWDDVGYHFVIRRDGTIEIGRDMTTVGVHTAGKNTGSIGICLIGGITKQGKPENNFTEQQWSTLDTLVNDLREELPNSVRIHGHNEFSAKACPSFDVQKWIKGERLN